MGVHRRLHGHPGEEVKMISLWVVPLGLLLVASLIVPLMISWDETSNRSDRDIPRLMDDAHVDTPEAPCRWSYYSNYRICLTHGIREGCDIDINAHRETT